MSVGTCNDANFADLKLLVSKWFDKHISINMLKVLYRDHIEETIPLHSPSTKTKELITMLIGCGHLGQHHLTLLYDTIKATKQFGLEEEIKNQMPSFKIPENIRDNVITKFTLHRQRIVKLGFALTEGDVRTISGLYEVEHIDSWSLIIELEHKMIICEEKMEEFIKRLKEHELHQAVKALTEDIPRPSSNSGQANVISLGLKRKRVELDPGSVSQPYKKTPLDMAIELSENIDNLSARDFPEFTTVFKEMYIFLKNINAHIHDITNGSIIFHLSVYDPYALMNLWEIHSSGELIKDLAKSVPHNLQDEFIKEWKTVVDKEEYESVLRRLKERVQYDSFIGIISDDTEFENQLKVDLQNRRPDLKFSIIKHWRLSKPETINHLIAKSRKVIIAFSPRPLTDYFKYAAHSVVIEMLEAKTLDDAKIIPVKLSEDAVVPSEFKLFNVVNACKEHFVDKILQELDECELEMEISKGNTDATEMVVKDSKEEPHVEISENTDESIDNLTEMVVKDSKEGFGLHPTEIVVKDSKEVQSDLYDFCILSNNPEWGNKLMGELQERIPDIKCTSKQDLSVLNKDNLINEIDKSKKVILGFSTPTDHPKSAVNVVKEMLEENTLHHAKLIPVKISEDAFVPPDFKLFTVANGWDDFVKELEEIYAKSIKTYSDSSYEIEDQNMKRSGSEISLSSFSSGYSTGTDMTSESTEPEDVSSSGESDTTSESTDPNPKFDETENFKIIKSLVIELGTQKMTKEFFKAFLKNERKKGSFEQMKDLKLKHKINSPDADFITFDISIIMTLIRYCCGFTYLDEDWEQPDQIDNRVLSNLIRIQQYKNTLDQNKRGRISTKEFEEDWNGIKDVLLDLGVQSTDIDAMKLRTGLNTVYFEEIQNFQAIMSLVLELGTEAVRKYVLQVNNIQEKDVGQFLMDEKDNLKKAKLLPEQKKKMFSKKADIRSFDIPIMMEIIRHCNQLPDSFWSEPDEEYINKLANLVRIHRYANTKLAHRANARMSNKDFQMEWKNLISILKGVGVATEKIEQYKPLHHTASSTS